MKTREEYIAASRKRNRDRGITEEQIRETSKPLPQEDIERRLEYQRQHGSDRPWEERPW